MCYIPQSVPPSLEYIMKHRIILSLAFFKIFFYFFLKALHIITEKHFCLRQKKKSHSLLCNLYLHCKICKKVWWLNKGVMFCTVSIMSTWFITKFSFQWHSSMEQSNWKRSTYVSRLSKLLTLHSIILMEQLWKNVANDEIQIISIVY